MSVIGTNRYLNDLPPRDHIQADKLMWKS